MSSLNVAFGALTDALVLLTILFISRAVYRLTTPVKLEEEIATKDNVAMGVTLTGFFLGVAIAASGGLLANGTPWERAVMVGLVGLVSIVLMRISLVINDKLILNRFNNLNEIVNDKNLGVAFVEAGGCIATGLMINGVMSGKATDPLEKLLYGLIYWAIGQTALIIGAKLFRPICGFDLDDQLETSNNAAAGLSFGGFMIAVGLIVRASLNGVSTNVLPELATIAVFVLIGFALLTVGKLALAKVLMPTSPLSAEISKEKNLAAGALSAGGYICIAIIFAASIAPATTFASFSSMLADNEPPATVQPAIDEKDSSAPAQAAPADEKQTNSAPAVTK